MKKVTEAALIVKAKTRGYNLYRSGGHAIVNGLPTNVPGKGYELSPDWDDLDGEGDVYCFSSRSQTTLRKIDEVLDDIPTLKQLEEFEAAAAKASPSSDSMQ